MGAGCGPALGPPVRWYFDGGDGRECPYSCEDSSALEAGYIAWIYIASPENAVEIVLGPNKWRYRVDFLRMTQENCHTGTVRSLTREAPAAVEVFNVSPPAPPPGMRSPRDMRPCPNVLPKENVLPDDFDMRVSREVTPQDFVAPIGNECTMLTYLLETLAIRFLSGFFVAAGTINSPEPLPRRQDLPDWAFIEYDSLDSHILASFVFVAISYGWIQQGHPDPKRFHLRFVSLFLGSETSARKIPDASFAIFWDFFSLYQIWGPNCQILGRSKDQERCFKAGLSYMHVVYGHKDIEILRIDVLPEEVAMNIDARGWPFFEKAVFTTAFKEASMSIRDERGFINREIRLPPMTPEQFDECMEHRHFTGRGDKQVCKALFRSLFERVFSQTDQVVYTEVHWNKGEFSQLALVVPRFERLIRLKISNKVDQEHPGLFEVIRAIPPTVVEIDLQNFEIDLHDTCGSALMQLWRNAQGRFKLFNVSHVIGLVCSTDVFGLRDFPHFPGGGSIGLGLRVGLDEAAAKSLFDFLRVGVNNFKFQALHVSLSGPHLRKPGIPFLTELAALLETCNSLKTLKVLEVYMYSLRPILHPETVGAVIRFQHLCQRLGVDCRCG